jgi:hypothetical protein
MRRFILAVIPSMVLTSRVGLADPPCSTIYTNKPCDAPVQWDPPSKGDTYVKSQYGTHIGAPPKPNKHIGASAGFGYHQVIYHHHTASSGKSKSANGKAPATNSRPAAGQ